MRKFADNQRTIKQRTFQQLSPLYPLWILEGAGQLVYLHDFLCLVNQVESGNWEPQFERIILNFFLSIITVVMYCTVLYSTVLYYTGPYTAMHSHDVSMSIITAIIL